MQDAELGPAAAISTGTIPVVEETLRVDKQLVDRGGVRVHKRVETHQQLVDEILHSEHVEIERRLINTAVADDAVPQTRQEGDTLVIPVLEEMLISVKRLILVEEVRITRVQGTERKPQTFFLRKEHIDIERLDPDHPPAGIESSVPPT